MKQAAQAPPQRELNRTLLTVSLVLTAISGVLSIGAWRSQGSPILFLEGALFSFSALGLALYAILPGKKQPSARKLILFLGGSAGILFSLMSRNSLDLTGFLMLVLCGALGVAVVHHLVTVFVGPVAFGRIWCGWGCWSAMVFDLLPFGRSPGRLAGRWTALPAAVLAINLCVAAVACYGFGYRGMATLHNLPRDSELYWIAVVNSLYYASGIALAFALKDNRAFCKYVCPTSVLLRISSRFSWIKIAGDKDLCNSCEACTRLCPMDIRIPDFVRQGQRVLSTECIMCRTCISACPENALGFSFGPNVRRGGNPAGGYPGLRYQSTSPASGDRPPRSGCDRRA